VPNLTGRYLEGVSKENLERVNQESAGKDADLQRGDNYHFFSKACDLSRRKRFEESFCEWGDGIETPEEGTEGTKGRGRFLLLGKETSC